MIALTRLDDSVVYVAAEQLLTLEPTPDTVVTLTTGARLLVRETVAEVIERVVAYRRRLAVAPDVLTRQDLE